MALDEESYVVESMCLLEISFNFQGTCIFCHCLAILASVFCKFFKELKFYQFLTMGACSQSTLLPANSFHRPHSSRASASALGRGCCPLPGYPLTISSISAIDGITRSAPLRVVMIDAAALANVSISVSFCLSKPSSPYFST